MRDRKFLPLSPEEQIAYARQLAAEQEWLDGLVEHFGTQKARSILLSEIEREANGESQYIN